MKMLLMAAIVFVSLTISGCSAQSRVTANNQTGLNSTITKLPQEKAAPSFILTELATNKKVSLKSLLAKGHPVILNAFASWCAPCNKEAPELQKLSEQYKGKVTFVGVDTTDTLSGVKKFVKRLHVTYPVLLDTSNNTFFNEYGGIGLPDTYVLNSHGKLVARHTGILSKTESKSIFHFAGKLT